MGIGIEEAIDDLIKTYSGGHRGITASPENKSYRNARKLKFVECKCARSDPAHGHKQYLARGPEGAMYYIAINPITRVVTCGPNGYHAKKKTKICI